jgi:predicted metal-dependent HD superfamily phosphohydrolase
VGEIDLLKVERMILATKKHLLPFETIVAELGIDGEGDREFRGQLAAVLDADLARLSLDFEKFTSHQNDILREYERFGEGLPPGVLRQKQDSFLVGFLKKHLEGGIYAHLVGSTSERESRAVANLQRWCFE